MRGRSSPLSVLAAALMLGEACSSEEASLRVGAMMNVILFVGDRIDETFLKESPTGGRPGCRLP